ncbi:F0F1 ATP synthase subunit delta [Bermanella marisrubri]|uniref:ATP synthase subunit delta n=1 Tax=Bermanella marisrubri TaxID=207949 RepID=Q1MZ54_9GAMM|nr:F0F1 ATP synthase subunit delta [Bermanella marisrubri]EAT11279.1 ATP synthase F1, delta subunit [Oceanobacter sp. RED65] [Bermanella marisrubri]QIZ82761.1 F0F1 ATP synthase subunit delta [Bermanella marisrubri]
MAELSTLARPYAKAAFQAAVEAGDLQAWSDMLAVASEVANNQDMEAVLSHPGLSGEQQAQTLIDVCGEKLNEAGQNLVNVLAENKRLALLPHILEQFEHLKAEQERVVDVEITSAFDVTDATKQKLTQALKAKLDKDVRVTTTVDSSLVGGAIIRAGDMVIDGTVRGKLAKLAEAMNS